MIKSQIKEELWCDCAIRLIMPESVESSNSIGILMTKIWQRKADKFRKNSRGLAVFRSLSVNSC